jgi:glycosyltransferase involved in cell wall biosynthesis
MLTHKRISLVVVNYKDEGSIRELHRRATEVFKKITSDYEIVYVNDASPDKSEQILRELAAQDDKLTVILHSRNFGRENAFTCGMMQANGDAVVIMDGDLQDPPELIEQFVAKWLEGYQVVYGVRIKREDSLSRVFKFFYRWFYIVFGKMVPFKVPRDTGDFSLMDRRVVDQLNALPEKDRFTRGLRAWVGFNQTGVGFVRAERYWGASTQQSLFKSFALARKAIFSFSYKPLEWIFTAAILSVFALLAALVFYIVNYFLHPDQPRGFSTLLVAVLFIGSVQLVVLSFISEYLRRIFEEVKSRPISIIQEIINDHKKNSR